MGRGDKISAQPVMDVTISKTKLNETKRRDGVKCLLYDARANAQHDVKAEMTLKKVLKQINPQMGLALMEKDYSSTNSNVLCGNQIWQESDWFILQLSIHSYRGKL